MSHAFMHFIVIALYVNLIDQQGSSLKQLFIALHSQ